jgi:GNAT superfamily N-acetyltransferase
MKAYEIDSETDTVATVGIATMADMDRLDFLLTLLFAQEADFCANSAKQRAGLERIIADPRIGHILVLRRQGEIIGMVNLLYTVSTALGGTVAILEDMIIHPDHRGGGAGSSLLQGALGFARQVGCLRITLLTDHDNSGAIRFYGRHGFSRSAMVPLRTIL